MVSGPLLPPWRRRGTTSHAVLALALGLASAAGCGGGGGGGASPEDTLARFRRALRAEDWDAAYDLLSEDYRREVSREAFRRHLAAHPEEVEATHEALGHPEGPPEVTARLVYGEGEALELRQREGRWVIVGNLVDFYDQSTPRAALRTFIRAVERGRYDVVLRLVPEGDKEGMTVDRLEETFEGEGREEVERLVANLRAHLDNPIDVVGDRATMPYGERFTAQLLREDGVWKIEDPD